MQIDTGQTCASSTLEHCTTTDACTTAGGYWYNNVCNAEPPLESSDEGLTGQAEVPACAPNWSCTDWQPAPETIACGQTFTQTRTCTDSNNCGTDEGKSPEAQEAAGTLCSASNATGTCQEGTCIFTCIDDYRKDDNGVCQPIPPAGQ